MKQKKGVYIILILAILFIGVGGGVYFFQNHEKEEKEKWISIDLEDPLLDQLYQIYDRIEFFETDKFNDFSIENLNKYNQIRTALSGLDESKINVCVKEEGEIQKSITLDELNDSLHQYILNDAITIDDLKQNSKDFGFTFGTYQYPNHAILVQGEKLYIIGRCKEETVVTSFKVLQTAFMKAAYLDDEYFIELKFAFGSASQEGNQMKYQFYKDYVEKELVETVEDPSDMDWSSYDVYRLTFQKVGNDYYFMKSNKVS